jgi:hypothetical protein
MGFGRRGGRSGRYAKSELESVGSWHRQECRGYFGA